MAELTADNNRKKLCIIMGGHFSASIGGAQYQAECIVDEIVKDGEYEIFYLARNINDQFIPCGYKIIRIENSSSLSRHTFLLDARPLTALLEIIKPDVIYQRGLKAYTAIGARYAKKHGVKFFFHIAHDYDVTPSKYFSSSWKSIVYLLEKKISSYGIRHATGIIAQTRRQAVLLEKNYSKKAALILPNIVSLPEKESVKSEEILKVAWVANFKAVKQPELFVDLAREFSDREDVKFVMIGRSGSDKEYGKLHKKIEATNNLNYLGELPIEQVNEQLSSSHVFVNTSKAEGYPNTFLQAWIRKVPIVSLHADIDGILKNGEYGILCGDYQKMVDAVRVLLSDQPRRVGMGEAARKFAKENNSIKNIAKLLELFTRDNRGFVI